MATHSSVLAWESQGRGSLVGCRLWGRTESDMTEATWQQSEIGVRKDGVKYEKYLAPSPRHMSSDR